MRSARTRLLATALVALLASVALAACGDDDDGDSSATTTSAPGDETTGPGPTDPAASGDTTVATAETGLGTVLVDADGFTLYIFTQDAADQSNCGSGCVEVWPPVAVDGDIAVGDGLDASLFGTITRDDGTTQLTVDQHPLYRYAPDEAPGDTNGQGIGDNWFVVGVDGQPIS